MAYHHGNLRNALLDRAEELAAESGLDKLKLSRLAKDLGVSHNAPSRHFANRDELIGAMAERALDGLESFIDSTPAIFDPDPLMRLKSLVKSTFLYAARNPAHFRLLAYPDILKVTGGAFAERHNAFIERFLQASNEAQGAGWRADTDPKQLAFLALALAVGIQLNRHFVMDAAEQGKRNQFTSEVQRESFVTDALDILFSN